MSCVSTEKPSDQNDNSRTGSCDATVGYVGLYVPAECRVYVSSFSGAVGFGFEGSGASASTIQPEAEGGECEKTEPETEDCTYSLSHGASVKRGGRVAEGTNFYTTNESSHRTVCSTSL